MSGLRSRSKGRRGEVEARHLLEELDWTIIPLGPGSRTEDIVATDPNGTTWSVEVKSQVTWRLCEWRKQAKSNAKKRKAQWLLMCRIPNMPATFYVEDSDGCRVWRGNGARGGQDE